MSYSSETWLIVTTSAEGARRAKKWQIYSFLVLRVKYILETMKKHTFFLKTISLAIGLFSLASTTVYAGGGEYHPLNFSYGQVISGRNFNIEMQVNNLNQGGYIVGEDFE